MKTGLAPILTAWLLVLSCAHQAAAQPPERPESPPSSGSVRNSLPRGIIVMWSGKLDALPAGWALCDGSNGTPDLRNRFVMGVGAPEYHGSTGGATNHRHQSDKHTHQINLPPLRVRQGYRGYGDFNGRGVRSRTYALPNQDLNIRPFQSLPATAAIPSADHLPPYYKLAFIMKL